MDIKGKIYNTRSNKKMENQDNYEEELECAVCLQTCVHPVRLPCSHIFCFLCVKGIANQSKRCAMCRQEIPADFLDNPDLLKKIEEKEKLRSEGYQWFYEGRNGWWQYDERTSHDLENAFSQGQRVFEMLVAGFLYSVDFDKMVQQRRNDPSRRRRIKRDLASIPKKGIAGLKLDSETTLQECSDGALEVNVQIASNRNDEQTEAEPAQSFSHSRVSIPDAESESNASYAPTDPASEDENLDMFHRGLLRDVIEYSSASRLDLIPERTLRNVQPDNLREPSYTAYRTRSHRTTSDNNRVHSISGGNVTGIVTSTNRNSSETLPSIRICNNISTGESRDVDTLSNSFEIFSLENEENEFYSLDGTEEYDLTLANDDEG